MIAARSGIEPSLSHAPVMQPGAARKLRPDPFCRCKCKTRCRRCRPAVQVAHPTDREMANRHAQSGKLRRCGAQVFFTQLLMRPLA